MRDMRNRARDVHQIIMGFHSSKGRATDMQIKLHIIPSALYMVCVRPVSDARGRLMGLEGYDDGAMRSTINRAVSIVFVQHIKVGGCSRKKYQAGFNDEREVTRRISVCVCVWCDCDDNNDYVVYAVHRWRVRKI